MHIYLVDANTVENRPQFSKGYPSLYNSIFLDKIWDFTYVYQIHDLLEDEKKENSLFIIDIFEHGNIFRNDKLKSELKSTRNKKLLLYGITKNWFHISSSMFSDFHIKVFLEESNFPIQDVTFIGQTKADVLALQNVFGQSINATWYDRWLEELWEYKMRHLLPMKRNYLTIDPNIPVKRFSIFCRRYDDFRMQIFTELLSKNIIENSHFTFGGYPENATEKKLSLDKMMSYVNTKLPDRLLPYKSKFLKWLERVPYEVDGEYSMSYHHFFTDKLDDYYKSSKINLVIESHVQCREIQSDWSLITEKTYKAMIFKKPFFIFSQPGTLKALRQMGYRTFHGIFNEYYDTIEDFDKRVLAITDEIERLNNLPEHEFNMIVEKCQHIVNHNYHVIMQEMTTTRTIPEQYMIKHIMKNYLSNQ